MKGFPDAVNIGFKTGGTPAPTGLDGTTLRHFIGPLAIAVVMAGATKDARKMLPEFKYNSFLRERRRSPFRFSDSHLEHSPTGEPPDWCSSG
jgi:hypothetical protein